MVRIDWRMKTFRYPIKKSLYNAAVELLAYPRMLFSSFSFWIFHVSMVSVLLSWLAMDLPFFLSGMDELIFEPGGLVYPIRIFHRYVGAVFVVGLILYAIQLATNKKLRHGLTRFDYVEFALIATVVAYGVSYTIGSIAGVQLLPSTLVTLALPMGARTFTVGFHIFVVYGWFLASIIFTGSIMKAIACISLVMTRGLSHPTVLKLRSEEMSRPFGNLTRYGVAQLLACGKDGDCVEACPVYDETKADTSSPRARLLAYRSEVCKRRGLTSLIFKRKVGKEAMEKVRDMLYECTLCGRCMSVCPVEFDLVNLWKAARESVFISGVAPEMVTKLSEMIRTERNLYGLPNTSRADWIDYESADVPKKEKAETIYFVGCVTSYSGRLGGVAKAVSAILTYLDEDWTILAGEEWCCGAPLDFSGATPGTEDAAQHNVEAIERMGAKKVIFNCPGCYRMFKEKYPQILGRPLNFQSLHIVEYLKLKLSDERLNPKSKFMGVATYHDPCELGRLVGLYDEPRAIISKYAERFTELPENRSAGRCCGTGGVMKVVEPNLASKVGVTRIKQVRDTGAELLLSACPACLIGLGEATMAENLPVRVADISQLVAQQLGLT